MSSDNSIIEQKYKAWLGTPARFRPPGITTPKQFAAKFDVDMETLELWQLRPRFWDDVFASARTVIGTELSSIMESLLVRAQGGSVQAIKLCLDLLGVHADTLELKHTFQDDQLVLIYGNKEIPEEIER